MKPRRARVAAFPRRLPFNPYCELLYGHLEKLGVETVEGRTRLGWLWRQRRRVRVLHYHWPERHFDARRTRSAVWFALRLLCARALGYRVVWTVHNAAPHEGETSGWRLVRAVLGRLATLVVHSPAGRGALGALGRDAVVIPHGSYIGHYPDTIKRAAARAQLDLPADARVLLAFGQVRPYKGLDTLARTFAEIETPGVRLVIAGRPVAGGDAGLGAVRDDRIRLFLRAVADDEVQVFFAAADIVVLPYRNVLTSGAAMLAFSFGRGVVAPRLGCLADLERSGGAILYDPAAPDGLRRALARALLVDTAALGRQARRVARGLSWDAIARRHLTAYGLAPTLTVLRPHAPIHVSRATVRPPRARGEDRWT
jgi:glycosyltransferase involved in cell wall biosynthesis